MVISFGNYYITTLQTETSSNQGILKIHPKLNTQVIIKTFAAPTIVRPKKTNRRSERKIPAKKGSRAALEKKHRPHPNLMKIGGTNAYYTCLVPIA